MLRLGVRRSRGEVNVERTQRWGSALVDFFFYFSSKLPLVPCQSPAVG